MSFLVYSVIIIFAFLMVVVITPVVIPLLHKLKFGQVVRSEGPKSHLKKMGTPTMGGVIFLVTMALVAFLYAKINFRIIALILVTLLFGLIGFIDDFIKIIKKRKDGLYPMQKMFGLILVATAFSFYAKEYIGTEIMIPFIDSTVNLGYLYIPFAILVLISATNAVNITDGLDGLAAGISIIVITFFMLVTRKIADYEYVSIFSAIMVGCLLGFLMYNKNPAKIFMGDTGSLALGGAIGGISLCMKNPLILIIVCGVCVIETLSVAIQVLSFKFRGKRVFKMAPIHHHFELSGFSERKVVAIFWGVSVILCVVGYFSIR